MNGLPPVFSSKWSGSTGKRGRAIVLETSIPIARHHGMCCFSTKTEVQGTTIFARLTGNGVQSLAYQMSYVAATPTAMILPLPVARPAREGSVRWKNLKEYPEFFPSLEHGFPEPPPFGLFRSKSAPVALAPLPVHEVGDFVASFVPSMADFARLDPRFVLSREVWSKIPAYDDYGFAVFQLKALSGSPHPIAFEFDTRLDRTVYFPTVHIHDGAVHETGDFDHALYLQEATIDARVADYEGPQTIDKRTGFVRSNAKAKAFVDATRSQGLIDPELLVHKITMRGSLPNRDTFFDLKMTHAARGCGRCDAGSGPMGSTPVHVGLAMAGLAWIIRRRNALRRS